MQTPRLYRIILPVPDIERATAFYRAVSGISGQRVSPGRHYFDCGGTLLACYDPVADGDGGLDDWRFHPFQYLYFAVPDLEAAMSRVQAAGGAVEEGIKTMPWGERMFYARDPFGSRISFVDERTLFTGDGEHEQMPGE
jgi:predicted enzyme related to lactoylglutathione lyase